MKIICIGRNYVEHARELNNPVPEKPVFFLKPDTALLLRRHPFFYPDFSNDIHFETELVLRISQNGKHIQEKFAGRYYDAIGIGIDFTARDVQAECKKKGLPWEIAKAFDQSAPVSEEFIPVSDIKDLKNIGFSMKINGKVRQEGNSNNMIFDFNRIIAYISRFITLKTGDLIFTGTPEGVGPINIGDKVEAFIEDRKLLEFNVK